MEAAQAHRLANNSHIIRALMEKGYSGTQFITEYLMVSYKDRNLTDEQVIKEIAGVDVVYDDVVIPKGNYTTTQRPVAIQQEPQQTVAGKAITDAMPNKVSSGHSVIALGITFLVILVYYLTPVDEWVNATGSFGDIIDIIFAIATMIITAATTASVTKPQ